MVFESAHSEIAPPRAGFAPRLSEISFFSFLLLIFVGLSPFAIRDPVAMAAAEGIKSGAGDAIRQVCFASVFALIVYSAVRESGLRTLAAVPPILAVLLLWCLMSAAWSPEPDITLRRAALSAVVVLSAMLGVSTIGAVRGLQLLRLVLALVLVVNWLSIPLVHQAVHLPGDPEPQLVGDWRGLYFHKNIAGAVSAITAIIFFFSAWEKRKVIDWLLCIAAIAFTVMTRSKSSLALLLLALAGGAVYQLAWRRTLDRLIVAVVFGLLAVGVILFAAIDQNAVAHLFTDPEEFTGRAEIWRAELAFIADHPVLGAGFGSFANTGTLSPIHNYVASNWVENVSHGHNAYLQLFVTIGGVGFVMAVAALIVAPLAAFLRAEGSYTASMSVLFAIFLFVVLHNFLESDFLEGDGATWVAFLLMLAALGDVRRTAQEIAVKP